MDLKSQPRKGSTSISVAAGSFDRRETLVSFDLPAHLEGSSYQIRDEKGRVLPLQIDGQRRATFVLPELAAGKTRTYRLISVKPNRVRRGAGVLLVRAGHLLNVKIAGRQVLSFVTQPPALPDKNIKPIFLRGGYIHPVYTPSGRMVTDDYPSDHFHHHGIWFAWTKTEFEGRHPDFWNVGTGSARIDFVSVEDTWSGDVNAGFRSRQRYVDLTSGSAKAALNEQWEVRVYRIGQSGSPYFMFDIVATQDCDDGSELKLEEYRYGGMGVRGHRDWKDKSKFSFLSSEGKNRREGDATRARWAHLSGPVDGRVAGIAILDHPGNLRAPQPMRMNPDDPFFNYAPSQLGPFTIKAGEKFMLRYRYIVSDGSPNVPELNRLWNDYANPPQVTVTGH